MKKHLFLFAAAAVALASCSSDDTIAESSSAFGNQQKEIAFSVFNQNATRAAGAAATNAVSGTDFPQNYTMQVAAYNYTDASHKGDYFGTTAGVNFSYQPRTSNGWWAGTTAAQYWPLSPTTLNFLAVTEVGPVGTDVVTSTFGEGGSTWAKQVSVALADNKPDATNYNQHDLMYANGQAAVTQNGNALSFGTNDAVAMTFNHALAWVYFRVKGATAAETTGDYAITINSITLNNAYYSGTFLAKLTTVETSSALSWDSDGSNLKWSSPASQSSNASPHYTQLGTSGTKVLAADFQNVGDGLLVVPTGSMTSTQVSFESFTINYTVRGNTYDYTYTPTDEQKTLLLGKKYVFDITFKLHEIFVDASVQNWESATTNYVDVPSTAFVNTSDGAFNMSIGSGAGVYTFQVSGLGATDASSVAVANVTDGTWDNKATLATAPSKSYNTTSKVATVSFEVAANESGEDKVYKITVKDGDGTAPTTGYTNTITITQGY